MHVPEPSFTESSPERIAEAMLEELRAPRAPHPVAGDDALRAAAMLSDILRRQAKAA
jgi:hypothetical protein